MTQAKHSTNRKEEILEYLKKYHTGRKNAIFSKELQDKFNLDGRVIRRYVSDLRKDGIPICSDDSGYYYASNQNEINATVGRLNCMVTGVSNARTGLLFSTTFTPKIHIEISLKGCENNG